ncbi:MAG: hypothetical protein EOP10_03860 [Proteobacteria bacterium]|nr:MAG: hypothetical protein EOP10_03860 [Pseudomonadota bacterium]
MSEKPELGSTKKDCISLDPSEIAKRWGINTKPLTDSFNSPHLSLEIKKRFEFWKKKQICIDIPQVKELVSSFQLEAQEVCRSKGLVAIPKYAIFKAAKSNKEFSDGAAKPESVPHWSAENRETAAKIFGLEMGAKAASAMKETSPPATTTVKTNSEVLISGKVLEIIGTGEHTKGTETTPTSSNVDFSKVENIVKANEALALKHPEITGRKADYECNGQSCKNLSNGESFPKSALQKVLGCVGKSYTYRPDNNFDPDDFKTNCVTKEAEKMLNESSKFTRDPDALIFEKDDPNLALAKGYCDSSYFGADHCRDWNMQAFTNLAVEINIEREEALTSALKTFKEKGECASNILGNSFCKDLRDKKFTSSNCDRDPEACSDKSVGKDSEILKDMPQYCRDALKNGRLTSSVGTATGSSGGGKDISGFFPLGLKGRDECISISARLALKGVDIISLRDFLITGICETNNPACVPEKTSNGSNDFESNSFGSGREGTFGEVDGSTHFFDEGIFSITNTPLPKVSSAGAGELSLKNKFKNIDTSSSHAPVKSGSIPKGRDF